MRRTSVNEFAAIGRGADAAAPELSRLGAIMPKHSRDIIVTNELGLHARPAVQFVDVASQFGSKVVVSRLEGEEISANGKSVMEMIILAAPKGTPLRIVAEGDDAEAAVARLAQLFIDNFGET